MKLESFENEIVRLESQLQEAIDALQTLKDIQAIFQDIQPRYERLKQLTDDATGFEGQYEAVRRQGEQLAQLAEQLCQNGAEWKATFTEYQQICKESQRETEQLIAALVQRYENQQNGLNALAANYQRGQAEIRQHMGQSIAEIQQANAILDKQLVLVRGDLRDLAENVMNELESKFGQQIRQRFQGALFVCFLALAVALGTLAALLLK
jgi:DNA repair exonuclease SbcCD ATPase subunit